MGWLFYKAKLGVVVKIAVSLHCGSVQCETLAFTVSGLFEVTVWLRGCIRGQGVVRGSGATALGYSGSGK